MDSSVSSSPQDIASSSDSARPREAKTKTNRPVRWWAKLLLAAVSLALALSCAEIGLRLADVHVPNATVLSAFFRHDSTTGWRGAPAAHGRFVTGDFDTVVSHDGNGLRATGDDRPLDQDGASEVPTVWCVGDSGTWGWGVNNGEVWVDRLNQFADGRVRYRNLGVPGFSSVQQYLLLKDHFEHGRKPAEVLLLFCHNDPSDNVTRDSDTPRPYVSAPPQSDDDELRIDGYPAPITRTWTWKQWLLKHSRFAQFANYNWQRLRNSTQRQRYIKREADAERRAAEVASNATPPTPAEPRAMTTEDAGYAVLRATYKRLRDLCAEHSVRLTIVGELQRQPKMLAICHDLEIPVIDPASDSDRPADFKSWRFVADPHLNAAGHEVLARRIHASREARLASSR